MVSRCAIISHFYFLQAAVSVVQAGMWYLFAAEAWGPAIHLLDVSASTARLVQTLAGHDGRVDCLTVTPDVGTLVSGVFVTTPLLSSCGTAKFEAITRRGIWRGHAERQTGTMHRCILLCGVAVERSARQEAGEERRKEGAGGPNPVAAWDKLPAVALVPSPPPQGVPTTWSASGGCGGPPAGRPPPRSPPASPGTAPPSPPSPPPQPCASSPAPTPAAASSSTLCPMVSTVHSGPHCALTLTGHSFGVINKMEFVGQLWIPKKPLGVIC